MVVPLHVACGHARQPREDGRHYVRRGVEVCGQRLEQRRDLMAIALAFQPMHVVGKRQARSRTQGDLCKCTG